MTYGFAANRLIQMAKEGVVTTYGYDGWGNLIQETVNGVTTEFVLDENTAYARILGEVRSDGGERLYAYGPEGFAVQQAVGGAVEYPLLDGLGSIRHLTDAAGNVFLTRSYDAYGNVRLTIGTGATRLGYTGEMQDPVSGLVYLRARHYHPVIGRFLQRDSFGGFGQRSQSLNRYSYAENNSSTYHDPSGHCATRSNGAPDPNDADCWRLAWTIANLWDETDYWQNRFGSVGVWDDRISPSAVDVEFMQGELEGYFLSPEYRNWRDMHPSSGPTNTGVGEWGDYVFIEGQYLILQSGVMLDQYGNIYFRIGVSFGTFGITGGIGDIFIDKGNCQLTSIDDLPEDVKSDLAKQALSGASASVSGGFVVSLAGARSWTSPHHLTAEGGPSWPFGPSGSVSPFTLSWPIARAWR